MGCMCVCAGGLQEADVAKCQLVCNEKLDSADPFRIFRAAMRNAHATTDTTRVSFGDAKHGLDVSSGPVFDHVAAPAAPPSVSISGLACPFGRQTLRTRFVLQFVVPGERKGLTPFVV